MNHRSNHESFETKYKEQLQTDTPDLWSRIEESIDTNKASASEHDMNYFNQPQTAHTSSKAYTKKMLSLAASIFIVVASAIAISSSGIFKDHSKESMNAADVHDGYFSNSDQMVQDNINAEANKGNSMQSGASNSIADAELENSPNDSDDMHILNEMSPSESVTRKIVIEQIKENPENHTEPWKITANILNETTNETLNNVTIFASNSIIDALEIGCTYEVILIQYNGNDCYHLKSIIE